MACSADLQVRSASPSGTLPTRWPGVRLRGISRSARRVAARDVDDLRDHGRRQLVAETPLEEGQRRGSVEGLKLDDLGRAERSRVAACRDEQRDPFRSDPSCDERQRLERGVVEQVRVVDANKKWVFLRRCGKQPQRAGVRGRSIAALGSGEAEGRRQRLAKGVREGADPAEERPAQFLEPRVRALAHVLDTGNPEDAHPVGALRGGVEQRCLPDPGLTADHNRAAAAGPGLVEQPADALLLTGTTKEPSSETVAVPAPLAAEAGRPWARAFSSQRRNS